MKQGEEEVFVRYQHRIIDSDPFGPIGEKLTDEPFVTTGKVGQATSHLVSAKESIPVVMLQLNALNSWLR